MRQAQYLFAAGSILMLLHATGALAQPSEQAHFEEVRGKLEAQYANLEKQGYKREALEIVVALDKDGEFPFQLALTAGASYTIVAACDNRCRHIEVILDAPDGKRLAQSPLEESVAIVAGAPSETGLHLGTIRMRDCPNEMCQAGLSVLRRDASN